MQEITSAIKEHFKTVIITGVCGVVVLVGGWIWSHAKEDGAKRLATDPDFYKELVNTIDTCCGIRGADEDLELLFRLAKDSTLVKNYFVANNENITRIQQNLGYILHNSNRLFLNQFDTAYHKGVKYYIDLDEDIYYEKDGYIYQAVYINAEDRYVYYEYDFRLQLGEKPRKYCTK